MRAASATWAGGMRPSGWWVRSWSGSRPTRMPTRLRDYDRQPAKGGCGRAQARRASGGTGGWGERDCRRALRSGEALMERRPGTVGTGAVGGGCLGAVPGTSTPTTGWPSSSSARLTAWRSPRPPRDDRTTDDVAPGRSRCRLGSLRGVHLQGFGVQVVGTRVERTRGPAGVIPPGRFPVVRWAWQMEP